MMIKIVELSEITIDIAVFAEVVLQSVREWIDDRGEGSSREESESHSCLIFFYHSVRNARK